MLPTAWASENPLHLEGYVDRLLGEPSARYREAMVSAEDDFQELSELLFRAKERYRSARATITHTVVAAGRREPLWAATLQPRWTKR